MLQRARPKAELTHRSYIFLRAKHADHGAARTRQGLQAFRSYSHRQALEFEAKYSECAGHQPLSQNVLHELR
jgi:hypothetical protein